MSLFASAISCGAERIEWPTFSFRSQRRCRIASATRSWTAVGAFAVRNMRSRSLNGAISPRPVPPSPTIDRRWDRFVDQSLGHEIIGEPDELVVEKCGRLCSRAAIAGLQRQPLGDFGAAIFERSAKDRRRFAVQFLPGGVRPAGRQPRGGR